MSNFEIGDNLSDSTVPTAEVVEVSSAQPVDGLSFSDLDSFLMCVEKSPEQAYIYLESLRTRCMAVEDELIALRQQDTEKDQVIKRLMIEALCDSKIDFVLNSRGVKFAFDIIKEQMHEEDTVLMLFLDINGFKNINKAITETRADMVIVNYADHLVKQVREGDVVGRMGGDEFCIIVNLDGVEDIDEYLKRFAGSINVPYEINGVYRRREIHSSVGYTKISKNTKYQDALQAANDAANLIKANGKTGVAYQSVDGDEINLHEFSRHNQRIVDSDD